VDKPTFDVRPTGQRDQTSIRRVGGVVSFYLPVRRDVITVVRHQRFDGVVPGGHSTRCLPSFFSDRPTDCLT
jgi:hypothetical protein